jgi:hypothetical protein
MDGSGADVRVRTSRLELTRLGLDPLASPQASAEVGRIMARDIRLRSAGTDCIPAGAPLRGSASEGYVVYSWRLDCPVAGEREVVSTLMLDVAPSHLHFARVVHPGSPPMERVLTEAHPLWHLGENEKSTDTNRAAGTSLLGYIGLGIEHILTGWDHLAFVVGLLLLAYTLRDIATLVTSFTLAHSLTLALAVLGVVKPEGHIVEALIGFSIALVGIENAWLLAGAGMRLPMLATGALLALTVWGAAALPRQTLFGLMIFTACHFLLLRHSSRPERLRAAVAFAFGLIHGFGFAGVMMELDLETVRLVPALFGFNAGVEIGQLAVVALVWPLLLLLRRDPTWGRLSAEMGSAAVCGLGLFWFVTRSFG